MICRLVLLLFLPLFLDSLVVPDCVTVETINESKI